MVLTAAAIGVGVYTETGLGAVLLMIMAGVLPWLLDLRYAMAWLIAAHVALVPAFMTMTRDQFTFWEALFQSMFYVGFAAFVMITTYVARQQAQAREEQRRLNAELRATRVLLAESARVNERTRILRDLHDGVGSHISAAIRQLQSGRASNDEVLQTLRDALDFALTSLRGNLAKSLLTVLGLGVGVGAVLTVLSLGDAGEIQVGVGRDDQRAAGELLAGVGADDQCAGRAALDLRQVLAVGKEGEIALPRLFQRGDTGHANVAVTVEFATQAIDQFLQSEHAR